MISIIVAASDNNVIGIENRLPWHLPADLLFFKNTTWGNPVIMGRKTFESMGSKPLKGRQNIVITRRKDYAPEGATVVSSIDAAITIAEDFDVDEIFITGGTEIFLQAFSLVDKIYITRVHTTLKGDAFFPVIDPDEWKLTHAEDHPADEKHEYSFTFQTWERRR